MQEVKKSFWGKLKDQMKENMNEQMEIAKSGRNKSIKLDYLGGHPKIPKAKEISITQGLEKNSIKLDGNLINVTRIEWDEKGKRSAGKAVAGAIIGGVLTAGVGTLVGAAIGGRKKDDSLAIITYMDDVIEHTVYFRCDQKEYAKLTALL